MPDQPMTVVETSESPWNYTDEMLLNAWQNIDEVVEKKSSDFVNDLISVTLDSHNIVFDPERMSPSQKTLLMEFLEKNYDYGLVVSPQEGKQFVSGEKTASIKSREIWGLTRFNLVIAKDKAYGWIRFRQPDFLTVAEISERTSEHLMKPKEIAELWPNRAGLYLYPVQEFFPFNKPRDIEPLEGIQVMARDVVLKEAEKIEKRQKIRMTTKIIKSMTNVDQRIILGEVLIPEVEDAQGDVASVDEIMKCAHGFMRSCQVVGLMHNSESDGLHVVECYTAPCDFPVEGREPVLKGSWLMATKVEDDKAWQDVLDEKLTGYSVEMYAFRTAV